MPTTIGSGASIHASGSKAVVEALDQARSSLEGKPDIGFIFASSKLRFPEVMSSARKELPDTRFLACSTAGEITERGLIRGGVVVMLLALEKESTLFGLSFAEELKKGYDEAARALSEPFNTIKPAAFKKGLSASTTVTLVDGLAGFGEKLVNAIRTHTRATQQVVGGAAGDDGAFNATWVGLDDHVGDNSAVALHIFGRNMWGVGVDHGLTAATEKMLVTKAKGSVVYELDGKPAFEAYKAFAAKRGKDLQPEAAGPFMIQHELGIYFLETIARARAPLAVQEGGALACAADVQEGAFVSILDGKKPDMVAAAGRAAREAQGNLGGQGAAGILLFDCICRGQLLGDAFSEEIAAVQSVFPGVPITGFLTYGEIARFKGRLDGWHNTTAVVAAIPA